MADDARTFRAALSATVDALRDSLDPATFAGGPRDAARIAATTVRRAGLRDASLLTRRIVTSGGVEATAARTAGTGIYYATAAIGGRGTVNATGRPAVGQVLFGAEFGGQRRTYVTGTAGTYRLRHARGASVRVQREQLRAEGRRTRQTTMQFRPYRRSGYWLFESLRDADALILAAYTAPLDDVVARFDRG